MWTKPTTPPTRCSWAGITTTDSAQTAPSSSEGRSPQRGRPSAVSAPECRPAAASVASLSSIFCRRTFSQCLFSRLPAHDAQPARMTGSEGVFRQRNTRLCPLLPNRQRARTSRHTGLRRMRCNTLHAFCIKISACNCANLSFNCGTIFAIQRRVSHKDTVSAQSDTAIYGVIQPSERHCTPFHVRNKNYNKQTCHLFVNTILNKTEWSVCLHCTRCVRLKAPVQPAAPAHVAPLYSHG